MKRSDADLLQGTLDLLILKTIALEPMHGYGVSVRIRQISQNVLRVQQGSLYPALYRLEQLGLIDYDWGISENGHKAKYYRLTRAGEKRLKQETASWERLSSAVMRIVEAT